jgi:hypothetical protein
MAECPAEGTRQFFITVSSGSNVGRSVIHHGQSLERYMVEKPKQQNTLRCIVVI